MLKSLKQKAAERNEDEFYFGMLSRGKFSADKLAGGKKWDGTVAGDRGNTALDMDTVRLMKTQDLGYLRTMRNVVAKEVQQLEQKAVITGAFAGIDANQLPDSDNDLDSDDDAAAPRKPKPQSRPNKIMFADSVEEVDEKLPEPEEDDDVDMSDDDDDDDFEKFEKEKDPQTLKREENAERLQRKLRNAKKKLKALTDAENALELQRARMAKTATVGGIAKNGKKIKVRERKR